MKALALVVLVGCAPNLIAPREYPQRVMPSLPEPAPEPNKSAVAIDADEPAQVEMLTGRYEGYTDTGHAVAGDSYTTICAQTPCTASLPAGAHQLRLTSLADPKRTSTDVLAVRHEPQLDYRMNLGHSEPSTVGGALPIGLGMMAMLTGLVFTGIGNFGQVDPITHMDDRTDFSKPGEALLIGGAVATVVGIAMLIHGRGTFQNASSVTWVP